MFLFASRTDTFGQVVLEAQASGLPVVAVDEGGPATLIEHGETGLLAPPRADAIADALLSIVSDGNSPRAHARAALAAVRGRTWEASLDRLAAGYRAGARTARGDRRAASPSLGVTASDGRSGLAQYASGVITDAVIPVGGLGTRMLPATRSLPKEMLPLVDKPAVQYVVEELRDAGIQRILFVTGRRKRAIEDHFDADPELERAVGQAASPASRAADRLHAPAPAPRGR